MRSRLQDSIAETPEGAFGGSTTAAAAEPAASSPGRQAPTGERRSQPRGATAATATASTGSSPAMMIPSRRPQGRYAVAAILVVVLLTAATVAWNSFFRYAAHGVIAGRVAKLSAPWPATLAAIRVRPGDAVRQGDVLASVDDPELAAEIDRTEDALRTAHAELDAEAARLVLADHEKQNGWQDARARYFELQGELQSEQARAAEFAARRARLEELAPTGAVVQEELDTLGHRQRGLADRITKLEQATAALAERVAQAGESGAAAAVDEARLRPLLANMESLRGELDRLRQKQARGTLRAPFSGSVVAVAGQIGEQVDATRTLVEVLEDRSLEVVAYVAPSRVTRFAGGSLATVVVVDTGAELECEVKHVGGRYEEKPLRSSSTPNATERLLPITLKLPAELPEGITLRLGAEVRVTAAGVHRTAASGGAG